MAYHGFESDPSPLLIVLFTLPVLYVGHCQYLRPHSVVCRTTDECDYQRIRKARVVAYRCRGICLKRLRKTINAVYFKTVDLEANS